MSSGVPVPARARLRRRVDGASLAVFRLSFGVVMVWEVWRYLRNGWVERYYIEPSFHFSYFGFDWVRPVPELMHEIFVGIGVAGLLVALGLCYRVASVVLFVGLSYVFLLDQTQYLNHFYLICAYAFVLALLPANRMLALDARLRPRLRREWTPAWALWSVRGLMALVYLYGAVAKWNTDWLTGWPMRLWLADRADFPLLGELFTRAETAIVMSWGGMLLDLLVVPGLLWRRTRWVALAAAVAFHMMNASLFHIGVFPILAVAATLTLLPPDWPRRVFHMPRRSDWEALPPRAPARWGERVVLAVLGVFFAVQVLAPLRHFAYPGEVHWTEEGHRFAWHMKLRDKWGDVRFALIWPESRITEPISVEPLLTPRQLRKMSTRPDMILQLAHHLADLHERDGVRPEVHAVAQCSLNGREPQLLVDPTVDLAAQPRTLWPADWIVPLRPLEVTD